MALPARPDIVSINGNPTYRSLEAVDQRHFNDLGTDLHRRKFVEMIYRLRAVDDPALRTGQAIVNEWRRSGRFLKHLRVPPVAPLAIAPLVAQKTPLPPIQTAPQPPVQAAPSPSRSPLAELSPRFANNYQSPDDLLSPTQGQVRYIQEQLNAPWKFASVIFQKATGHEDIVNKSMYRFVRTGSNDVIEEQLAVKCLEVSDLDQEQVTRELQINRLVARTQCSHLLQCKGTGSRRLTRKVNDTQRSQSTAFIYQDFANYDNLDRLIADHEEKSKKIDEHYIWYTLHELTEALSALHDGKCPRPCQQQADLPHSADYQDLPSEPWMPILHLDIKSDNVMLLKENKEYPSYPKPVLGDFNLSHINNSDFQNRLTSVDGPRFDGTDGWQPPERVFESLIGYGKNRRINPDYAPHQWPVNEKADIWGLGKIAHHMIFAHRPDLYKGTLSTQAWSELQGDTQESYLLAWKLAVSDCCSQELYALVQRMLRHNPALRPDLDALRTSVYRGLRKLNLLYSNEVRSKRKRELPDHMQIYPSLESDGPAKFDIGQTYSPIRKRLRVNIDDAIVRAQYSQLIATWNGKNLTPSQAAQIGVVDAFDAYLVRGQVFELDQAEEWTAKHLISCLRKRLHQDFGSIYVLKNSDIIYKVIDDAMSVEGKLQILDYVDDDFWNFATASSQDAQNAFQHAIQWARWMLQNCLVDGKLAEPRGAMLTDKSDLHQGIYDWLFIKPSGAWYKN